MQSIDTATRYFRDGGDYLILAGGAEALSHAPLVFNRRAVAWLLRVLIQPFGPRRRGPPDHVMQACAAIITEPNAARDRLTVDLYRSKPGQSDGVALLERAFATTVATEPIRKRMHDAHLRDIGEAAARGIITADEAAALKTAAEAVSAAIAVNDFAPEELTSRGAKTAASKPASQGDEPSRANPQRPAAAE
jgi:acyl-CoA dehydrogenase